MLGYAMGDTFGGMTTIEDSLLSASAAGTAAAGTAAAGGTAAGGARASARKSAGARKRRRAGDGEDADDDAHATGGAQTTTRASGKRHRNKRFLWTDALHRAFIVAVFECTFQLSIGSGRAGRDASFEHCVLCCAQL